jgi:hypothetical protein
LDNQQHLIHPDDTLAENFVIGDLLPGEYDLFVELQGENYRLPVVVNGGQMSRVEIVTAPYKTVTPTPAVTDQMMATPSPGESN